MRRPRRERASPTVHRKRLRGRCHERQQARSDARRPAPGQPIALAPWARTSTSELRVTIKLIKQRSSCATTGPVSTAVISRAPRRPAPMWLGGSSAVLSGDAAPRHAIVAYALGCIRVYRAQKDEATQEPEHHDNVSHMMSPTRSMAAILTESARACHAPSKSPRPIGHGTSIGGHAR
jgi:hypothetical protein